MQPTVDVSLAFMKLAALTGISLVWANLTVNAFKLGWHIATFSLGKEEEKSLPEIVMCDDEKCFIHEKSLCQDCRERN